MAKKEKPKKDITLREHLQSIAAKGGNARAENLTAKQKTAIATKAGKVGGKARAKSLTAARRSEIARAAVVKRWDNAKKNAD